MSFHKGQDRTGWKRPRYRAIGWQEADQIEYKLRQATLFSRVPKDALKDIAAHHETSQLTIAKIARARGIDTAA